jgi:hypothetical protein
VVRVVEVRPQLLLALQQQVWAVTRAEVFANQHRYVVLLV